MSEDGWVGEVLSFWFDELTPEDWFMGGDAVDKAIVERFGPLHGRLKQSQPETARTDARTALATVIVLDQFSRNMFRGQATAFAADDVAASIARNAIDSGLDQRLTEQQRQFLYMPLMHAESLADQERCVMLFASILNGENLNHAVEHRDIVARFGRFPHRNRALGRRSTPDEEEFLKTAKGFGQ